MSDSFAENMVVSFLLPVPRTTTVTARVDRHHNTKGPHCQTGSTGYFLRGTHTRNGHKALRTVTYRRTLSTVFRYRSGSDWMWGLHRALLSSRSVSSLPRYGMADTRSSPHCVNLKYHLRHYTILNQKKCYF